MGWFDNDGKDKAQAPVQPVRPDVTPAAAPRPQAVSGSTLGERVQINGTIVSDEDLTILGVVEGTIHARATLKVAKEAKVKATVHGRSVHVEGTLQGDVVASDTILLGPTAAMQGNIRTPSLQIREGAFFKGGVEMASAAPKATESKASEPERAQASKPAAKTAARPAAPAQGTASAAAGQQKLPATSEAGS